MSLKYLLAAACMAMLLGVGTSANALETEFVLTGTVTGAPTQNQPFGDGIADTTGNTFGENGASLVGANFVVTFYINTSVGTLDITNDITNDPPVQAEEVHGGSQYGEPSPVSASLEINGVTQYFPGSDAINGNAIVSLSYPFILGVTTPNSSITAFVGCDGEGDLSISTCPSEYDSVTAFGQSFSFPNLTNYESVPLTFELPTASGSLYVANLSSPGIVNFTSAAPEPPSWLLMISGVGLAGGVLRRRRRVGAAPLPVGAGV